MSRPRRAVAAVRGTVGRVRRLLGVAAGTALGGAGLVLGVVTLGFAATAPATGCLLGGGVDCLAAPLAAVDAAVRWVGSLLLLYAGITTLARAWR